MSLPLYLRSANTMRRSPGHSPELCRDFHHHIREGNLAAMLEMLENEPRLVNAQNADQATALMVATSHPDTERALEMMKLLYGRGAHLGPRDSHHRHVLLYACTHDVGVAVVQTLLVWNAKQRKRKFRWTDRDSQGRTASVIASELANTPVTKLLLDTLDAWQSAKEHHSFKVLQVAIESGNEEHALEVALHPTIQAWFKSPTRTLHVGVGGACNMFLTTAAAVDAGMLELLQVLNQLNQQEVSRVVWFKIHRLCRDAPEVLTTVSRVLRRIGMHFDDTWRWKQIRDVCLVRYSCHRDGIEGEQCLLASVPAT